MAHITNTLQPHFTGHVGPVRFTNGHAETDDPEMVAYFQADPDRYAVDPQDHELDDQLDPDDRQE